MHSPLRVAIDVPECALCLTVGGQPIYNDTSLFASDVLFIDLF